MVDTQFRHVLKTSTDRTKLASVLAMMLAVPLFSHLGFAIGAHDAGRISQLLVLIVAAICLLIQAHCFETPSGQLNAPALTTVAVVLVLAVTSALAAADTARALREASLLAGLIAIVICIASVKIEILFTAGLPAIALGSGMYAIVASGIAAFVVASEKTLMPAELFFGYDNYRFFNHVQTVAIPLLALCTTSPTVDRRIRALAWTGLVLNLMLTMLAAGRATSLGFIASCTASLLVFRAAALPLVGRMVLGALLGALVYVLLTQALPAWLGVSAVNTLGAVSDTGSYEARLYLWKLAIGYIGEAPWFGIGPMHYAHRINIEAAHPHNIYLQVAAEWGVPMLLLLLALATRGLWRMRQCIVACRDAGSRTVGIGLFTACVAVAVDGFFSGNFVMPISQMWIAFLFGWSIAWCRSQQPVGVEAQGAVQKSGPVRTWAWRGLALAALASQVWLIADVYPEATHLSEHLEHVQKELAPNPRTNPRFWSHGWF